MYIKHCQSDIFICKLFNLPCFMNGLFHNDIRVFSKALEMSPKGGTASPEGGS